MKQMISRYPAGAGESVPANPIARIALGVAVVLTSVSVFGSARGETTVSGNVSGTWTLANSPYVVTGNVTVPGATTLAVHPGVVVRVRPGLSIAVNGTLDTQGTQSQPVLFTSSADTTGGAPAPGGWVGLFAQAGSVVQLTHTVLRYGGAGGWANLANSNGPASSVSVAGGGVYFSADDGMRIQAASITLTGMQASNNAADGIELFPGLPPVLSSISMVGNGGYACRVMQNPGSFPATMLASTNGKNGVYVAGTLGGAAPGGTWTWGASPTCAYIIAAVTCAGGDTLRVLPGAVVKFDTSGSYLSVNGTGAKLHAGTPGGQEVWFTSIKDDGHLGDTNGDGAASQPAPGQWTAVFADNFCELELDRVVFQYGGAAGWGQIATSASAANSIRWYEGGASFSANDGVRVSAVNFDLRNLDVHANAIDGLEIYPGNPPVISGTMNMNNNGGYGCRIMQNPGSVAAYFTGVYNGVSGIYVSGTLGGGAPADTWTWSPSSSFPYVIDAMTVSGPDTLQIAAGSVVKFHTSGSALTVQGGGAVLRSLGTSESPVWFTSLKDDTHGSDTNGDGGATAPAGGDWSRVDVTNSGSLDLGYTYFAYGGSGGWANLATSAGSAASVVWSGGGAHNSANDGIRVASQTISLANLGATGNAVDGLEIYPGNSPSFTGTFTCNGNGGYGVRVMQNPGSFAAFFSGSGNGMSGIYLAGTIGGSAAAGRWDWSASPQFPYVIDAVTLTGADTLEVAAGSVVKFHVAGSAFTLTGAGVLLRTMGTENNPVWFTSRHDDTHGGDTNGNGGATLPAGGDWSRIDLTNAAAADLSYTSFAYGGSGGWANIATSAGVAASLEWQGGGCHFSANDGIRVGSQQMVLADLTATGNAVDGIELLPSASPILQGTIACENNGGYGARIIQSPGSIQAHFSGSGNGVNGIYLAGTIGGGAPAATWTWNASPLFPYVIDGVTLAGPDTLSLAAGSVVKFHVDSSALTVTGSGAHLRTQGTEEAPVWFTSRRDDAIGGDTNNDGAATTPAGGEWSRIDLTNSASADLAHTFLAYGGGAGWANLACSAATAGRLEWNGGGTSFSANDGLRGSFAQLHLQGLRVMNNGVDGLELYASGSPVVEQCDFTGHNSGASYCGLRNNLPGVTVDARNCWWGDASGPFDPSTGPPDHNPAGLGDRVSDYVLYRDWAGSPQTNLSPDPFALLSPAPGAEIPVFDVTFTWESTTDPEGTAITYELWVDDDPAFATPIAEITGLTTTSRTVGAIAVAGVPVYWRVIARDGDGRGRLATPFLSSFMIPVSAGLEEDDSGGVIAFAVGALYPNPALGGATISFAIPEASRVQIDLYDAAGRHVRPVADATFARGEHAVAWTGSDRDGRRLAGGVYFCRLRNGPRSVTQRFVVTR